MRLTARLIPEQDFENFRLPLTKVDLNIQLGSREGLTYVLLLKDHCVEVFGELGQCIFKDFLRNLLLRIFDAYDVLGTRLLENLTNG